MSDDTSVDGAVWRKNFYQHLTLERHAGKLTLHRQEALYVMMVLWEIGERPTDAEVAAEARVSARTVLRARKDARDLGLLKLAKQLRQLFSV